ncbi:RNA polymerase sigma factor [Thalassoglobus sp.]|uniref:RNA polymerase sigma factor n=1 Tax=Thalassoglobus sp. TaxID=2795869 RepID=UPI003AA93F1C
MEEDSQENFEELISEVYRAESRQAFATLVRLLGDFDLAEEMLHEAFAVAMSQWPRDGVPQNRRAWLISTARFKAIDAIRRRQRFAGQLPEIMARLQEIGDENEANAVSEIQDDRLRLIFTCCHPAIDRSVQIPLTLREVCGLTTEEIASAFLVTPPTMAQRIVRGKAKIRDARIPYVVPSLTELPERLDAVLSVVYLIFNEAYSASAGDNLTRADLSEEAIRLARLILELLPDAEVMGLLALMLLHESRRPARTTAEGDIVLLEDQNRSLWNRELIDEGLQLVEQAMATGRIGAYTIQAAISGVHASSKTSESTDWAQVVSLYDVLFRAAPTPIVELNRAVAMAMRDGPEVGVQLIDTILARGDLTDYHLAHSARGELLRRSGRIADARTAFENALTLTKQEPEKKFLNRKLNELSSATTSSQ